jgi:Farnesoic acid 0-methyl transferase
MIEIMIGIMNNTRSGIRRNQAEPFVVNVPTPNILTGGVFNEFRITWVNFFVLVFRGDEEFPFMGFTMTDFFPVNFYGIRSA